MNAYLLSIGNEVVSGNVINTNASYIALSLGKLGIEVSKVITIPDREEDIIEAVKSFLDSSSTLLITTGGLGPTHDDLTKNAVCKALGLNLVYNETAARDMFLYFGGEKNDCNLNQAYFPEGAKIITNRVGSADGAIINYHDKIIMMLVGPHSELKAMFNDAITYLGNIENDVLYVDKMLFGNSESYFENLLEPLGKKFPQIEISPYVSYGRIRYRIKTTKQYQNEFNDFLKQFDNAVGDYLYSNVEEEINETVVKKLIEKGLTVTFAESCTGGLLAKLITDIPGASQVFFQSFITYSEEAKMKILHVDPVTIKNYGVVSTNVTSEMIKGLESNVKADIYASISGYAGPSGDVGLVCFSVKYQDKIVNFEKRYHGTREMIRMRAAYEILYQIYLMIR